MKLPGQSRQAPAADLSPTAEVAPASPPQPQTKLAMATATLQAAEGVFTAAHAELGALRARVGQTEQALVALDRKLGLTDNVLNATDQLDQRVRLQQELDRTKPLVPVLERKVKQAGDQRHRAELERNAIQAQIADLLDRIDQHEVRIAHHRYYVAEAEGLFRGRQHTMFTYEQALALRRAELLELGGQET